MFSSLQYIRTKGGLQNVERLVPLYELGSESPAAGDGSTTVFYTEHAPIVDNNNDGSVDEYDVIVYVNGTAVTVTTVDAEQGKITLASAPANNAVLAVTYAWSPSDDSDVTIARAFANGEISGAISRVYTMPIDDVSVNADFSGSSGEAVLKECEAMLAAASLLMNREGETNSDVDTMAEKLSKRAHDIINSIVERDRSLLDTEGVEFSTNSRQQMHGYPDQDATDGGNAGPYFTVDQAL